MRETSEATLASTLCTVCLQSFTPEAGEQQCPDCRRMMQAKRTPPAYRPQPFHDDDRGTSRRCSAAKPSSMKGWRLVLAAGALLAIGVASGVLLFPGRSIQHPPGVLVAEDPVQWDLSESTSFVVDNYQIAALASYEIKARVLSKKRYWTGREADLSPCDLALGWGPMSDQSVVDRMSIRQSRRWYRYRYDSPPIPQRSIETHSANTHIIPASDAVASRLGDVVKGHIVEMTGYLVLVTGGDGWRWKSSLSRDDRGGHSCEVFYVEDLVIHE